MVTYSLPLYTSLHSDSTSPERHEIQRETERHRKKRKITQHKERECYKRRDTELRRSATLPHLSSKGCTLKEDTRKTSVQPDKVNETIIFCNCEDFVYQARIVEVRKISRKHYSLSPLTSAFFVKNMRAV